MGEAAELLVAGLVTSLLVRVWVPARSAAVQLLLGAAATVAVGSLVDPGRFRWAAAAAAAGALVAAATGRLWPAPTAPATAAAGPGGTSAPR